MRLNIYSCFLSETIETYWRDALRIAFESPRKCVWVTSELFWVTSKLPSSHIARSCVWDNSELRLSHLGITFESPRNYAWMTLIAKLVAITWPLVTYRVPSVNSLITEVIPHGPEHACVWIYIPDFYQRLSKLTEKMPSELHLSHLGKAFESPRSCFWITLELPLSHLARNCFWNNSELRFRHLGITFESPRNYVWVTSELLWIALIAKLVAITWPLETYRVFPVNCYIFEIIPHGPEHACVRIYSWFLSESIETNSRETLRIAFESPRNCFWVTSELPSSHLARNCVWDNSESRLSRLGITFEWPWSLNWSPLLDHL